MNVILVVVLSTSGLGITAVVEVTTSVEVPFSSLRGVVVVFSSSGTVVDGGMSTTSVEVSFSSLRGPVVVFSSSGTVVDGVASVIFAVVFISGPGIKQLSARVEASWAVVHPSGH